MRLRFHCGLAADKTASEKHSSNALFMEAAACTLYLTCISHVNNSLIVYTDKKPDRRLAKRQNRTWMINNKDNYNQFQFCATINAERLQTLKKSF